ncbi:MAG: UDP-glucose/GDP-mannose dehydrogenase family protein [Candidatus Edwardsbacteria bacterium]
MKISVFGAGYVGLVSGTCFADLGHQVICVDNDTQKIEILKRGEMPIYEPGLKEMIAQNVKAGRLLFTESIEEGVKSSTIIFIAVGTPPKENGEADLTAVENVATKIAETMEDYKLIVEKSTVPVQTGIWLKRTVARNNRKGIEFDVASNPEFLREGTAISDFLHPDRVVIGVESEKARKMLEELYKPLNAPILVTDIESAEIIKHASNSFLATKISFINAIADICERTGADIIKVAEGIGLDKRIGRSFLDAGIGFGGFCFPKDLQAFIRISEKLGYDFQLLKEVEKINEEQKKFFVKKIKDLLWNLSGKTIGILGLAFKPNTDDMRFAPSIDIIKDLQNEGAKIKTYDPCAMEKAKKIFTDVQFCPDAYEVAKETDALGILTEWDEFKGLDLLRLKSLMKQPIIVDGRNIFEPEKMKELGFIYKGVGR